MNDLIDMRMIMLEIPNIKQICNLDSEKEVEDYLILYTIYNNLLMKYLSKFFQFKIIDNEIHNHSHLFSPVNLSDFNLYQYLSKKHFKYLSIQNILHVEKLNESDRKFLFNLYESNGQLNETAINFIEKTLFDIVLRENNNMLNVACNYKLNNSNSFKLKQYIKDLMKLLSENVQKKFGVSLNIVDKHFTDLEVELLMKMNRDKLSIIDIKNKNSSEYKFF